MVASVLIGVLALAGDAHAATAKPAKKAGVESAVRAAAVNLVKNFDKGSAEPFLRGVDGDSFPNFIDFREGVRDFLVHNKQINTDIMIDKVLHSGDRAAVQFRWFQSYQDTSGETQKDNGRCEFILRRLPNREWILTAIHGSSPFS